MLLGFEATSILTPAYCMGIRWHMTHDNESRQRMRAHCQQVITINLTSVHTAWYAGGLLRRKSETPFVQRSESYAKRLTTSVPQAFRRQSGSRLGCMGTRIM